MVEYVAKSPVRVKTPEQVFGCREFFVGGENNGMCGELIGYGNHYFAHIGKDIYRARLIDNSDGKRWVIN